MRRTIFNKYSHPCVVIAVLTSVWVDLIIGVVSGVGEVLTGMNVNVLVCFMFPVYSIKDFSNKNETEN